MREGFREELWQTLATACDYKWTDSERHKRIFEFAYEAHSGQFRKYTSEPYIWHPVRVAILASKELPFSLSSVALLHDVVEDCGVTVDEIADEFDPITADMIELLTDKPHSFGNRAARQEEKINRLAEAPLAVQFIKLADWLDNWPSIRDNDPDFAKVYRREVVECLVEMDAMSPLRKQLVMELGPDEEGRLEV